MKTIRRLIHREVAVAVALVSLGFLALFFFFDLVDELQYLGKHNGLSGDASIYQLKHALLYVALLVPNRLYELLPISVLIGAIFVMTRLAQSSEYTILRTSGLGPWRALRLLMALGVFFVGLNFVLGDYVIPVTDQAAQLLKARYRGKITVGQTGAWLKEKQTYNTYVVNIKELSPNNEMRGIEIFEFDNQGLIVSTTQAPAGVFASTNDAWQLQRASRAEFEIRADSSRAGQAGGSARVTRSMIENFRWPTGLSAEMVSVALLNPERMGTIDLFNYVSHLNANGQAAQRYEIQFWNKIFYPLSCLVMVILALPFAYLHFRSGGTAGYVFAGVMIGISFFLLNNVFGYIGNLRTWQPWLAAAAPGLLYMTASLGAFGWLVLRH